MHFQLAMVTMHCTQPGTKFSLPSFLFNSGTFLLLSYVVFIFFEMDTVYIYIYIYICGIYIQGLVNSFQNQLEKLAWLIFPNECHRMDIAKMSPYISCLTSIEQLDLQRHSCTVAIACVLLKTTLLFPSSPPLLLHPSPPVRPPVSWCEPSLRHSL